MFVSENETMPFLPISIFNYLLHMVETTLSFYCKLQILKYCKVLNYQIILNADHMCVKCSSKEASLLTAESSFPCWEPSVRHALNMHRNLNSKAVVFTVAFIFPSLFISYCDCKDTHKSISSSETFKSFFFNVYVSIGAREKKN